MKGDSGKRAGKRRIKCKGIKEKRSDSRKTVIKCKGIKEKRGDSRKTVIKRGKIPRFLVDLHTRTSLNVVIDRDIWPIETFETI